jgi:hypothetical protein
LKFARSQEDSAEIVALIDCVELDVGPGQLPIHYVEEHESGASKSTLMGATVTGTVDIVRAPKRPRVVVEFYLPDPPGPHGGESAADFVGRLMAEIRTKAPVALPGRAKTAEKYRLAAQTPPEEN